MKLGVARLLTLPVVPALVILIGCGPTKSPPTPITAADAVSVILDTEDGGITWSSYHTDLATVLKGIALLGPNSIVAVGNAGRIILTTDGGSHWTMPTSPTSAFLQDVTGTVIAGEGVAVGTAGTILRTVDNGETWGTITTGITASLNAVEINPLGIGLAVGDFNTILLSTNQGRTWATVNSGGFEALNGVAFADPDTVVAVGSGGTILRSTDAGANWTPVSSGIIRDLQAITFISPTVGIAVGMYDPLGSQIFRTTDAGLTWQARPLPLGDVYVLQDVVSASGICVAVGTKRRILRSTDGGETWIVNGSQPYEETLNSILFFDDTIGYIVGE